MAVFQIDIQKRLGNEFWTNRYFTDAAILAEAHVNAQTVMNQERSFHGDAVEFVSYRTSTIAEGDDVFLSSPISLFGAVSFGNYLPLFNVVKVQLTTAGTRPYFKLYRGCLFEENTTGSLIDAATVDLVGDGISGMIDIITSGLGVLFGGYAVNPRIQMRQLRRGKRKRSGPVIPVN